MKDGALITAIMVAGQRRELTTPIRVYEGDTFYFRLENGKPVVGVNRTTDCEVTLSVGTMPKP